MKGRLAGPSENCSKCFVSASQLPAEGPKESFSLSFFNRLPVFFFYIYIFKFIL